MLRNLALFAGPLLLTVAQCRAANLPPFAVIGYLPEWRYEGANFDTLSRGLDALILFSAEPLPDGRLSGLDRLPRAELLAEARAAATAHNTALLVCYGGNGRSSGFSAMVRSVSARKRFVSATAALIKEKRFDGVDLNWCVQGTACSVCGTSGQPWRADTLRPCGGVEKRAWWC